MAELNAEERKELPKSDMGVPETRSDTKGEGGYPIEDEAHAKDAISRASHNASPEEKHELAERVHEKYPAMDDHGKKGKLHDWLKSPKREKKSE